MERQVQNLTCFEYEGRTLPLRPFGTFGKSSSGVRTIASGRRSDYVEG